MALLNFNVNVKGLDGKEIEGNDSTLAKVLANFIAGENSTEDTMKWFTWAMSLFNEGTVDVDDTDREKIEKFVKGHKNMTNLLKGQILEVLKK